MSSHVVLTADRHIIKAPLGFFRVPRKLPSWILNSERVVKYEQSYPCIKLINEVDYTMHMRVIRSFLEDENKGNHEVVVSPYCKYLFNELKAEIDKLQDSIYDMNHADKTQNIAIDIIHKLSAICDTTFKFETSNKTPQLISSLESAVNGFELYIRPSNAPTAKEKEFDDTIRKYNNNRGC
jgi:hypothetical protein